MPGRPNSSRDRMSGQLSRGNSTALPVQLDFSAVRGPRCTVDEVETNRRSSHPSTLPGRPGAGTTEEPRRGRSSVTLLTRSAPSEGLRNAIITPDAPSTRPSHFLAGGRVRDLASGARRLPAHHITIRVPWHDGGWTGHMCGKPLDNTSCLVLKRIGAEKRDEVEVALRGNTASVPQLAMPPCVDERSHSWRPSSSPGPSSTPMWRPRRTYGHFAPTPFRQPAYSAAAFPSGGCSGRRSRGPTTTGKAWRSGWASAGSRTASRACSSTRPGCKSARTS